MMAHWEIFLGRKWRVSTGYNTEELRSFKYVMYPVLVDDCIRDELCITLARVHGLDVVKARYGTYVVFREDAMLALLILLDEGTLI